MNPFRTAYLYLIFPFRWIKNIQRKVNLLIDLYDAYITAAHEKKTQLAINIFKRIQRIRKL